VLDHLRRNLSSGRRASLTFDEEERRVAKAGTVRSRREYIEARRLHARERDAKRYEFAEELAASARHVIPPELGFAVFPPGAIDVAAPVVEAANARYAELGEEAMRERLNKSRFYASGLLPPEAFELGTPYLDFALSDEVVGPIAAYFGMVPVLYEIDLWYSVHADSTPQSSQQWHIDPTDATSMKVWVHCSDVGPENGPLTALAAAESDDGPTRSATRSTRRTTACPTRGSRTSRSGWSSSRGRPAASRSSTRAAASTWAAAYGRAPRRAGW
jgi:hypothetical protein